VTPRLFDKYLRGRVSALLMGVSFGVPEHSEDRSVDAFEGYVFGCAGGSGRGL
jgi:hypothetical protein